MKKKTAIIAVILVCVLCAACLFACGNKNDNSAANVVKPDINQALENYKSLEKKRSSFRADLAVKLFTARKNGDENVIVPVPIVETLALDRAYNNGTIYLDGKVYTSEIDDLIPGMYSALMHVMDSSADTTNDPILRYLRGETSFSLKMGYNDGSYNLKMKYDDGKNGGGSFWGATDNTSVDELLKAMHADLSFHPNDYLMTSGIIDLTDISEWLDKDEGGDKFSSVQNRFIYNFKVSSEKLHDLIFKYIDKWAASLDKEEYADLLNIIDQVIPYLSKWITIGNSTVDAKVLENGYPDEMSTSLVVNVNINLNELDQVLNLAISNSDRAKQYSSLIKAVYLALSLRGTEGQVGTIGFSFELSVKENFSYDGADPDLDSECFLPATEDVEGREEFLFRAENENPETPAE